MRVLLIFIDKNETKAGYIRDPDREDVIRWVGIAWRGIIVEIFKKSFKKAKLLEYHQGITGIQDNICILDA